MSTSKPENMKVQLGLVPNLWAIEFFEPEKKIFSPERSSSGWIALKLSRPALVWVNPVFENHGQLALFTQFRSSKML